MNLRNARPMNKPFACFAAGLALAVVGCTQDQHKFRSTQFEPKTLHIIETGTEELLWSYEIPVGYDLKITMRDGDSADSVLVSYNEGNPDVAEYQLVEWEDQGGDVVEEGEVELTGNHVSFDLEIREAPEFYKPYEPEADEDEALPTPEADDELEAPESEAEAEVEAETPTE